MRILPLVILAAVSSPAFGQPPPGSLQARLEAIDPATATVTACSEQVTRAAALNGFDLFYAVALCGAADQQLEATYLQAVGQVRSMADMASIMPATSSDAARVAELYGFIYAVAGGPGDDAVLRDPVSRQRLFDLIERWAPIYSPEYQPGWNDRRRLDSQAYRSRIAELKTHRLGQLREIAQVYSDDIYFALHRRFQELQRQTGGRYVEGTAEAERSALLQRQMNERAVAIGVRQATREVDADSLPEARFPSNNPLADEAVLSHSSDPVIRKCEQSAEFQTIAADSRIERVLVTQSQEWGVIWRADIREQDGALTRYTCTDRTTSSRPFHGPDEPLDPLPAN